MKTGIVTLLIGFSFTLCTFAQQPNKPTTKLQPIHIESELFEHENEELESDSLQTSDETLYKNVWSSTQIRYPANTLPDKNDTIVITLLEKGDRPFVFPVKGKVISKYGFRGRRMHTGTDIRLNSGDSVLCAFDGRVRLAKRFNGYGNLVLVRHNNGLETIYAHLKSIHVNINDSIKAGDLIGLGGRTGRATCDHLHFETRLFGEPFDSGKYIDFEKMALASDKIYYKNKQFEIDLAHFKRKPAGEFLANAPGGATKHVIKKGDTLSVIAQKYNTSVKKICAANNITAQKTLQIGTVLKIN